MRVPVYVRMCVKVHVQVCVVKKCRGRGRERCHFDPHADYKFTGLWCRFKPNFLRLYLSNSTVLHQQHGQ